MIWRRTFKKGFDSKCIVPAVNHGDSSVTVCGCFTRKGTGQLCILDRVMDRFYYRDNLEQHLLPSICFYARQRSEAHIWFN